jgi:predicted CoA-binding protein
VARPPDSDAQIRRVLEEARVIAVVGASPKPERDSHGVMAFLQSQGYRCIPVNPASREPEILGEKVYPSLADVPEPIDLVDVFRRSEQAGAVIDEAIAMGAGAVWLQLGVRDEAAAARAEQAGLGVVMDRCPKIEMPRLGISGPRQPG